MPISVSEFNNIIKEILQNNVSQRLEVEGEISNFKVSGKNLFCTLKDNDSAVSIIKWDYDNNLNLKNGDKVTINGKIQVYTKSGNYSIIAYKIEKTGQGNIHNNYEKIKEEYTRLGYFDENIKKKIPTINKLCIITSPEGAALQDILFVLNKNNYQGKIIIKRSIVQGTMCPKSVSDSIKQMNKWKDPVDNKPFDCILVSRGGGSFEDLMGYSDPKVIEAIYESNIFVISAIGHEVDFMLSDFAADLRSPTPSIAAEIICQSNQESKKILEYKQWIDTTRERICNYIENMKLKLENLESRNTNPLDLISKYQDNLNELNNKIMNIYKDKINNYKNKIEQLDKMNEKFNIDNMYENGCSFVFQDNKLITKLSLLDKTKPITIRFIDGEFEVKID